jgi:hypothetical protein
MTDEMTPKTTGSTTEAGSDEFAWTEPEQASGDAGAKAREWISQLQTMIENLATQAAPIVKEVGAKAAELAAIAGDKAGPVAQKAAEFTGQAGQKLAEKSRDLAVELRRDAGTTKTGIAEGAEGVTDSSDSDTPTTAGVA